MSNVLCNGNIHDHIQDKIDKFLFISLFLIRPIGLDMIVKNCPNITSDTAI